jgi:hypothetical protein
MKFDLLGAVLAMLVPGITSAAEPSPRVPVLAELFTSEGCPSCPPADLMLMELDRKQPVRKAQIIVLSEHVDYWNGLGWSDPFSSAQFSARQTAYSKALKSEVYTPQLVIDGSEQLVGSDTGAILAAITRAASRPKLPIKIESVRQDGSKAVSAFLWKAVQAMCGSPWRTNATNRACDEERIRGESWRMWRWCAIW